MGLTRNQPNHLTEWELIMLYNPSPDIKILDVTKLKAFAHDKFIITKTTTSLFGRRENTVGKGENDGNQRFPLFLKCFPKPSSGELLKSCDCVGKS